MNMKAHNTNSQFTQTIIHSPSFHFAPDKQNDRDLRHVSAKQSRYCEKDDCIHCFHGEG